MVCKRKRHLGLKSIPHETLNDGLRGKKHLNTTYAYAHIRNRIADEIIDAIVVIQARLTNYTSTSIRCWN